MSTIFALSSGQPPSGVAVIRLSGPRAFPVVKAMIKGDWPPARQATLKAIYHPKSGDLLDEGLVLLFPGPHSFTGEDVAELHLHGSRAVMEAVSAALIGEGLEPAEPGAFTRRAFRNQKMGLTQVEGLGDILQAETAAQLSLARKQADGRLAAHYEAWRKQIIAIQAQIEAELDFSDEELPANLMAGLGAEVSKLLEDLAAHVQDNARAERVRAGIKVVLTGPPNAGKSTLLNLLAQRDVAIVSEEAGTTRDSLEVHLDLVGYAVTVVDTAGLRETDSHVERQGIARAKAHSDDADVLVAMTAPGLASPDLDRDADFQLMNKSDLAAPDVAGWTPLSLKTGEGVDAFVEALTEHVSRVYDLGGVVATGHIRHQAALSQTISALEQAVDRLSGGQEELIVLAAEDCRSATAALGRILGTIDVEDVLDAIFSAFCIGK